MHSVNDTAIVVVHHGLDFLAQKILLNNGTVNITVTNGDAVDWQEITENSYYLCWTILFGVLDIAVLIWIFVLFFRELWNNDKKLNVVSFYLILQCVVYLCKSPTARVLLSQAVFGLILLIPFTETGFYGSQLFFSVLYLFQ